MRFRLIFKVKTKEVPSDNRRIFISFLKKSFEDYDKGVFEKYYKERDNIEKPYAFSVYFGKANFTKEKIILDENRITFTFSTFDSEAGLHFYNAVLAMKEKVFFLEKGNFIFLEEIHLIREKPIIKEQIIFHTLSPILIREHDKETNKDWYYSFEEAKSESVLKKSMRHQAVNCFGVEVENDVNQIVIKPLKMKKLVINHYNVFVTGNVGTFEMLGKPYLLEYFYKAGISSKKSEGFGLCNIID